MAVLPVWLQSLISFLIAIWPGLLWALFCLWAINWKKMSAVLREGAWVPAALLVFLAALVWSRVAPSSYSVLGVFQVPNLWWQLGAVSLYVGIGLFAGWLQLKYSWTPPEYAVEPAPHAHGDGHHGHDHHHVPNPVKGESATHTEEKFVDTGGEH